MYEPTVALNDIEIAGLFKVIEKHKADGAGIANCVTILRDRAYIDTVEAPETPLSKIIQLMVGRKVIQNAPIIPDTLKKRRRT